MLGGPQPARPALAGCGLRIRHSGSLSSRSRRKRARSRCRRRNDYAGPRAGEPGRREPEMFWDTMPRSTTNPRRSFASSTLQPSHICHSPITRWMGFFVPAFSSTFPTPRLVSRNLPASCAPVACWLSPWRTAIRFVRKAQVATHRLGRVLGQRWCAFLDYSHNEYAAAGFRALLKDARLRHRQCHSFWQPHSALAAAPGIRWVVVGLLRRPRIMVRASSIGVILSAAVLQAERRISRLSSAVI